MFELSKTSKFDDLDGVELTMSEYQKLAMRTCNISKCNGDKLFHAVFGLNAEAGEVASIFQKIYQGHELDAEHLCKELGDALWMIAEACEAAGTTLNEVAIMNIEKLRKRYPKGFDSKRSINRAKDDI